MRAKKNDSQLEAMAQHWENNKQILNKFHIFIPLISMHCTKCSLNDTDSYKTKLSFSKLHRSNCFTLVQYRRLPTILDSSGIWVTQNTANCSPQLTMLLQHSKRIAHNVTINSVSFIYFPLRWLMKLALTSPTSGGRSVGIVRSRTKAMEF
jgi:hypothetical protein